MATETQQRVETPKICNTTNQTNTCYGPSIAFLPPNKGDIPTYVFKALNRRKQVRTKNAVWPVPSSAKRTQYTALLNPILTLNVPYAYTSSTAIIYSVCSLALLSWRS